MVFKAFLPLIFLFIGFNSVEAQVNHKKIDSLIDLADKKIDVYEALNLAFRADSIATVNGLNRALTQKTLGMYWRIHGDYVESLKYLYGAEYDVDSVYSPKLYAEIKHQKGEAYRASNQFTKAFDDLTDALHVYFRLKDTLGIANIYNRLAASSYEIRFFTEAGFNPLFFTDDQEARISDVLDEFKGVFAHGDSLLIYIEKANRFAKAVQNKNIQVSTAIIDASFDVKNKEYDRAKEKFLQILDWIIEDQFNEDISLVYMNMAFMYTGQHLGIPDSIIHYCNLALPHAERQGVRMYKLLIYKALRDAYFSKGNHKKALTASDSVFNIHRTLNIEHLKINELNKQLENNRLREKEMVKYNHRITLTITAASIIIIVIIIVFMLILFSKNREQQKLLVVLKKKNSFITEQNQMLNTLNAEKDRFFSIVAHDLRGPFSSISGLVELQLSAIEVNNIDEVETYTNLIQESSTKSLDLIANLRLWARNQMGSLTFNPEKTNLKSLIHGVFELNKVFAEQKRISLLMDDVDEDCVAVVDVNMMQTTLRNVIGNAIKFTFPGGRVEVSCTQTLSRTLIKVIDNGIGMPPEISKNLFKLDTPVGRQGTDGESSTGLGLILCNDFIKTHHGTITVESKEDKGSIFTIEFPNTQPKSNA